MPVENIWSGFDPLQLSVFELETEASVLQAGGRGSPSPAVREGLSGLGTR